VVVVVVVVVVVWAEGGGTVGRCGLGGPRTCRVCEGKLG
jgi:hypothetical protein